MPDERLRIKYPYLLLCEGKDAFNFLCNYLNSSSLSQEPKFSTLIQVMDFGGNSDLRNFLINLKNMDQFDQVKSLAVIRDAEKDYQRACVEVERDLKKSGNIPPEQCSTWVKDGKLKIGYTLFPLNNREGTLEDLCLQILSEDNKDILSSIDSFLTQMELSYGRQYRQKHKNRLYTYLASSEKYVTMPLGLASTAGAFNWDSIYLEPLKKFIAEGFPD